MNILLAGGSCSLVDSLILKLRKEGHRVYILTGDKYRHNKYKKVFEKYEFPYDSENLGEIVQSVNPDVTIDEHSGCTLSNKEGKSDFSVIRRSI